MLRLELHPAASEEVEEAHGWYLREASVKIAGAFIDELDRAFDAIREVGGAQYLALVHSWHSPPDEVSLIL